MGVEKKLVVVVNGSAIGISFKKEAKAAIFGDLGKRFLHGYKDRVQANFLPFQNGRNILPCFRNASSDIW